MQTNKVKYIFMVGIGGSDLAARAVWTAMTLHKPDTGKRIFFLESPDSREYAEVEDFVNNKLADLEEVILIAVSKSGETPETLEAFHRTLDILSEKFGAPITERALVISTKGSPLWKLAEDRKMETLEWEDNIGGRWSAFTVAHTEVLKIAGLNVERFKEGGGEFDQNKAKELAEKIFESFKNGAEVLDFFFFNSRLEDLGKWCRQLIAESLATLTPTVSLGPTDLHSMLELYLEQPGSRFTLFVMSEKEIDKSINENAYENVAKAFKERNLPFDKYEMPEINEYEMGKFMGFMMAVTLELAKLLDVDPYDQPEVEKYKENLHNS